MTRLADNAVSLLLFAGALAFASTPAARAQAVAHADKAHDHSGAPSSSPLPSAAAPPPGIGATPIAWVDDANLMAPGAIAVDVSLTRWHGDGVAETTVPIVSFAAGVADRLQLAVSVPHVVGDAASGLEGGLGTTYVSGKYAAYRNDRGLKIAVAPTLELLGSGVLASLGPGESRAQVGVPVSIELDQAGRRLYASSGWFSRGVWFVGGGFGSQLSRRVGVSGSFSRSWTSSAGDAPPDISRDRAEVTAGVAYAVATHVSIFASAAHTIATLAENGAGATMSAGMSFYVAPARIAARR